MLLQSQLQVKQSQKVFSFFFNKKIFKKVKRYYNSYKLYLIQLPLHLCSLSPEFFDKFQLRLHKFDLGSIVIHKFINIYGHLQLLQP